MNTSDTSRQLGRFIAASGMTNLADGIAVVVWAWMATLLTRDPLLVVLMPVALRMPWLLMVLPAGVVIDRMDRRRVMFAMDILRASAFAVAALLVWLALPLPEPPADGAGAPLLFGALLVCAVIVGTAEVFRDIAAQTMLPTLVPHAELERANGRLWSVELVGNALIGPVLGAFLIAFVIWVPFALNAAILALAAVMMLSLRGQFRPKQAGVRDWRKELGEGLRFLRAAPLLRLLAVVTGVWNLLHQMVVIALVLHVQENLGLGAQGYGLVLAAGAVGGIIGGLVAERVIGRLGAGATAQWMMLASALAFGAIVFAPNAWVLALVLAFFELTGLIWDTVSLSYRQRAIPDALLGRVNSVYRLLAWGMMPVGLLLSGLIVSWSEALMPREAALTMPFVAAGLGAALLTAFAWRALGRGFAKI